MVYVDPVFIQMPALLALRRVALALTRDGVQTSSPKLAWLLSPASLQIVAPFAVLNGVSVSQTFVASAIDGLHILLAVDEAEPKRAVARYPAISADLTLSVDLNDGAGGGVPGVPASVSARVKLNGTFAEREVVAVERQTDGVWRVAGSQRVADGVIDLQVTGGDVYAMGADDFGSQFEPLLEVVVAQRVRPSLYAGWLYQITEPGTLPATEPQWWAAEGDNAPRLLGTARAIAVRYYQPLAHGPVPVEII